VLHVAVQPRKCMRKQMDREHGTSSTWNTEHTLQSIDLLHGTKLAALVCLTCHWYDGCCICQLHSCVRDTPVLIPQHKGCWPRPVHFLHA